MKNGFISDLHYSGYTNNHLVEYKGIKTPETLAYIDATLRNILNELVKRGITRLIVGGDIFHNKSIVYVDAAEMFRETIEEYPSIEWIMIHGNHDVSARTSSGKSAIRIFDNIKNVNIIKNKFEKIGNILYVPWSTDLPTIVNQNKADILVSHFGLNEGILNSGLSLVSEVKMSDLDKNYKLCLCGHYHKPQQITSNSCNFYYGGSIVQLDWGESGDDKRFLIFDDETLEVESVLTEGYKKYVKLDITSENKDEVLEKAKTLKEQGNDVKIFMFEKMDGAVDNKMGISVVDKTEKDITNRGIDSSMEDKDIFIKYLQIKEIPEDKQDKYLGVMLSIVENTSV